MAVYWFWSFFWLHKESICLVGSHMYVANVKPKVMAIHSFWSLVGLTKHFCVFLKPYSTMNVLIEHQVVISTHGEKARPPRTWWSQVAEVEANQLWPTSSFCTWSQPCPIPRVKSLRRPWHLRPARKPRRTEANLFSQTQQPSSHRRNKDIVACMPRWPYSQHTMIKAHTCYTWNKEQYLPCFLYASHGLCSHCGLAFFFVCLYGYTSAQALLGFSICMPSWPYIHH